MTLLFFLICLAIGFGIQSLSPFFLNKDRLKKNIQTNLSLGLVSFLMFGYVGKRALLYLVSWNYSNQFGLMNFFGFSNPLKLLLGVLALDLTAYLWHVANHKSGFLWRFHLVHHTDRVFDPTTALRFHPGEVFISLVVRSAVIVVLGISVDALAIFESVYLFFNFLEHSNVFLRLEIRQLLHPLFITPSLHVVHHTLNVDEQNSNFGTIFSIWDRVFGTLKDADPSPPFKFGVAQHREKLTLRQLLYLPFTATV